MRTAAPVPAPDAETARAARVRLATAASAHEPVGSGNYDPRRPLWLYPVRVRRRKNVLEAGLLARLAGANLIVTLPASSAAETPYSQEVERLFAESDIPGLCGVGERLDAHGLSFDDLLAAAHLIVSPSVEEGFGFQFVNALQWRRPLLARRLPVLDDLEALLDGYPAVVYDAVHCPLTPATRRALRAATSRSWSAPRACSRIPPATACAPKSIVILLGDTVDFSYLGAAQQAAVLRRCSDAGVARELRQANAELLDTVQAVAHRPPPDRRERIEAAFGEAAFARRSAACWRRSSLPVQGARDGTSVAGSAHAAIDPRAVRRAFAKPAALRLLMES